jgi:hypothetical protein
MSSLEMYEENMSLHPNFEVLSDIYTKYAAEMKAVRAQLTSPCDDIVVYRYLKGWKFDVPTTITQMNNMLAWRAENKMDLVRQQAAKMEVKDFPYQDLLMQCYPKNDFHGYDKKGQPVSVERIGKLDLALFLKLFTLETIFENFKYIFEKRALLQEEASARSGKLIRFCRILDLEGVGRQHLNPSGISMLKSILGQGTSNYPETLGTMFIVNAPWAFSSIWAWISPMLKESTQKKIHVLGADYKEVPKQNKF